METTPASCSVPDPCPSGPMNVCDFGQSMWVMLSEKLWAQLTCSSTGKGNKQWPQAGKLWLYKMITWLQEWLFCHYASFMAHIWPVRGLREGWTAAEEPLALLGHSAASGLPAVAIHSVGSLGNGFSSLQNLVVEWMPPSVDSFSPLTSHTLAVINSYTGQEQAIAAMPEQEVQMLSWLSILCL